MTLLLREWWDELLKTLAKPVGRSERWGGCFRRGWVLGLNGLCVLV